MSIRELILFKFCLLLLVTKFTVNSMDSDDNQLVALEDDENNDLNNLNQGKEFEKCALFNHQI